MRCAGVAVSGRQTLTFVGRRATAKKDFLYYTDFLSGLEQVIARRLTGTFNLSAGESHSVREVIKLSVEKSHRSLRVIGMPNRGPFGMWKTAGSTTSE